MLRSTPVTLIAAGVVEVDVSLLVDWVKNVRQAGRVVLTFRGRRIEAVATELSPQQAAPHLRDALAGAGRSARMVLDPFFETGVDAPIEDWEAEAVRHPMFWLEPVVVDPVREAGHRV